MQLAWHCIQLNCRLDCDRPEVMGDAMHAQAVILMQPGSGELT